MSASRYEYRWCVWCDGGRTHANCPACNGYGFQYVRATRNPTDDDEVTVSPAVGVQRQGPTRGES